MHESELKSSQRAIHWRLLQEKFGPKTVFIKGPKNIVADALSRLRKQGYIVGHVEAVLPFAPNNVENFIVQLQLI